jgi:hypothetical protein
MASSQFRWSSFRFDCQAGHAYSTTGLITDLRYCKSSVGDRAECLSSSTKCKRLLTLEQISSTFGPNSDYW